MITFNHEMLCPPADAVAFRVYGQACSKANSRRLIPGKIKADGSYSRPMSIKSSEALKFQRDFIRQVPSVARRMLTGKVVVWITVYYASERPDLDESIVLDSMQPVYRGKGDDKLMVQKGVYANDRQVRQKHIFHSVDKSNPRVEIFVAPLQPQQIQVPLLPHVSRETEPEPF